MNTPIKPNANSVLLGTLFVLATAPIYANDYPNRPDQQQQQPDRQEQQRLLRQHIANQARIEHEALINRAREIIAQDEDEQQVLNARLALAAVAEGNIDAIHALINEGANINAVL